MNIWCLVFLTKYAFIILKLSGIFQDLPTHEKKHPAECFSSTKWLFEKGRRADNKLSARVLWKKSYKLFICLQLKYIHESWRNHVIYVKGFWMKFKQNVNKSLARPVLRRKESKYCLPSWKAGADLVKYFQIVQNTEWMVQRKEELIIWRIRL